MLFLSFIWYMGSLTIVGAYITLLFIPCVPQFFKDLFFYGKVKAKTESFVRCIEISKQSFIYFYLLGSIVNCITMTVCLYFYMYHIPFPNAINWILKLSLGSGIQTQTNTFTPILISFMMSLQCQRRYNECVHTSIFSHSKINIFHFMLGIFLYTTFPLAVLSQSVPPDSNETSIFIQIGYQHILGLILFLIASYSQQTAHKKLAELRLDKKTGHVKDLNHHIPRGWMFEYISCPHFLSEVFIYYSFSFVDSFQSEILKAILLFVTLNQTITAHMNHTWYKRTFKDYPKERKAIFPYVL